MEINCIEADMDMADRARARCPKNENPTLMNNQDGKDREDDKTIT